MEKIMKIFTNTYPASYDVLSPLIEFNHLDKTFSFRDLATKKMVTLSIEELDYITYGED